MNLQSDNVGFKRPKYTSFPIIRNEIIVEECEEEEDKISRLPDEILTHILSLLPDADAYRTRILSNRWNHLCFFLPSLRFVHSYKSRLSVEEFHDFVEKSLAFRNRDMPVIKRFFLSCSCKYNYERVLHWLGIVLHSKVETLELRFAEDKKLIVFWNPFTICSNTLVDLTLVGVFLLDDDPSETNMCFPFLKKINLESMKYSRNQSLQNLISACPVLQELCLDRQELRSDFHSFKISSPSLKRLRIVERDGFKVSEVVIDAPKLEYLSIDSLYCNRYSLTNLWCLVEAYIDIYEDRDVKVYTPISSARILTLTKSSLLGLSRNEGLNLPVFPNLVKLIVDFMEIPAWDLLFIFLNKMPNLQHITIDFGWHGSPFKRRWNPPTEAPACLRFMVKEVVIRNENAVQVKDHVTLIRYLLSNSSVLEKLSLSTFDVDRKGRDNLLKIRRRSKLCRIEFVEAY